MMTIRLQNEAPLYLLLKTTCFLGCERHLSDTLYTNLILRCDGITSMFGMFHSLYRKGRRLPLAEERANCNKARIKTNDLMAPAYDWLASIVSRMDAVNLITRREKIWGNSPDQSHSYLSPRYNSRSVFKLI